MKEELEPRREKEYLQDEEWIAKQTTEVMWHVIQVKVERIWTEYGQQCHMEQRNKKNGKWKGLMSWYLSGH